MAKTEVEEVLKIETSFLNKHGYFTGRRDGVITWTSDTYRREQSKVGIEVITEGDDKYIRFEYTQTSRTGDIREFDYKIPLITTPCYFGRVRYWFECNSVKNVAYCRRRVGVLYKDGDYFGCRHCYNLTYKSRNLSGFSKSFGVLRSDDEIDAMLYDLKRTHYKGKPTKKYLRYLKISKHTEQSYKQIFRLINRKS